MQKVSKINRLIKKRDWSESDLKEFGQLTGRNLIKTGNLLHIGVDIENMEQFMKNLTEISSKINSAKQSKHFLEVVSLKLQIIDFYLRLLVNEFEGKNVPAKEFFGDN